MRALNNPSVPAQSLPACNADTGDAGGHATARPVTPASATVLSLVGMQLVGPLASGVHPTRELPEWHWAW